MNKTQMYQVTWIFKEEDEVHNISMKNLSQADEYMGMLLKRGVDAVKVEVINTSINVQQIRGINTDLLN